MRNTKRPLSLLLAALALLGCLGLTASAADTGSYTNFVRTHTYWDRIFSDVPAEAWYRDSVAAVYELGLLNAGAGVFQPEAELMRFEALSLSARLHSLFATGTMDFTPASQEAAEAVEFVDPEEPEETEAAAPPEETPFGEPILTEPPEPAEAETPEEPEDPYQVRYQVYADYCLEHGLIDEPAVELNTVVTRREFITMLARAMPASALPPVNEVADNTLPDVKMDAPGAAEIYLLYRAGVLTGSDEYGSFAPETPIRHSEVVTVLSRMVYRSLREKQALAVRPYPDLPELSPGDEASFAGSAMLGNSLVQGLQLQAPFAGFDFYAAQSATVLNADTLVAQLCQQSYRRVYIEFGINEFSMDPGRFAEAYGAILDRIREAMPAADLYVMSMTPVTAARDAEGRFTMEGIRAMNETLYRLCAEKQCWYLDCCTPLEDAAGFLPAEWAGWDGSPHLGGDGYAAWWYLIRTHYV